MKPARMRELFGLWQQEKTDPGPFYTELAKDTVGGLDRQYGPLRGQRIGVLRLPAGCAFRSRCPRAEPRCAEPPPMAEYRPGRFARCIHPYNVDAAAA